MSCIQCGTQLCQCAANQAAIQHSINQHQAGMNYRSMQQAQMNQVYGQQFPAYNDDQDYQLFKKYAHLTEQEMMEAFLGEQKEMERQAEEGAKMLVQKAKDRNQALKEEFWKWCAKYRRNMTEERFNTYFKMFL